MHDCDKKIAKKNKRIKTLRNYILNRLPQYKTEIKELNRKVNNLLNYIDDFTNSDLYVENEKLKMQIKELETNIDIFLAHQLR